MQPKMHSKRLTEIVVGSNEAVGVWTDPLTAHGGVWMNPAATDIHQGVWTDPFSTTTAVDGNQLGVATVSRRRRSKFLRTSDILGRARTYPAVDILTTTHKGAARGDAARWSLLPWQLEDHAELSTGQFV